jgi:UDP-N-acetylmuramoyl-tripeptide--D-alanyl-D-alanine ligase
MYTSTEQLYEIFKKYPIACTDTRDIKPHSLFFALKGDKFNANEFAEKALEQGGEYAVIDEEKYKKNNRYLLVKDVLTALQQLANYHRKQLTIPVIALTGSNGKTTTKELINMVLGQKYFTLATKGNLNNHIGVPLTLLNITNKHEIAIVEMGANHQQEIEQLCAIAEPNYGMITNIGKAHLEGFGGYEGVIKAKCEMYDFIQKSNGKLFVNADNILLKEKSQHIDRVLYGTSEGVNFKGKYLGSNPFVKLKIQPDSKSENIEEQPTINTQLIGGYNFENILAAACIGNFFGISEQLIQKGLEAYVPSNNRSQIVQTETNFLLLDAYNANPSSMKAAIENFAAMDKPNKVVILGDMLELGSESEKEHANIVELLKEKNISSVMLVGPHFKKAAASTQATLFNTSDEALEYLRQHPIKNSNFLIKGSRGIKLEKLAEAL